MVVTGSLLLRLPDALLLRRSHIFTDFAQVAKQFPILGRWLVFFLFLQDVPYQLANILVVSLGVFVHILR